MILRQSTNHHRRAPALLEAACGPPLRLSSDIDTPLGVDASEANAKIEPEYPEHVPPTDIVVLNEIIGLPEPRAEDESGAIDSFGSPDFLAAFHDEEQEKLAPRVNQDCDALDTDLLDFDEGPAREELEQDISTDGKNARRQRALQEAIRLGSPYGWEKPEIYLLAEVFEKYWWSSAKRSMVRELEAGLQPDELRLALATREIWRQYDEFAVNSVGHPYTALGWAMALIIVRSFHAYPEPEEIENFLLEAYAEWRWRSSLAQRHRSYVDYLISRLGFPNERYLVSPSVTLESDYDWSEDDYLSSNHVGLNTPEHQALVEYGLMPGMWVDSFAMGSPKNQDEIGDGEMNTRRFHLGFLFQNAGT